MSDEEPRVLLFSSKGQIRRLVPLLLDSWAIPFAVLETGESSGLEMLEFFPDCHTLIIDDDRGEAWQQATHDQIRAVDREIGVILLSRKAGEDLRKVAPGQWNDTALSLRCHRCQAGKCFVLPVPFGGNMLHQLLLLLD